ncbi:DNA primase [Tenuibacillus multivorans]|uniref:DNA primase n=1 Tax=Tenuibacillus multivorans TaxID=237069 RepID=A0A1G9ZCL2_9BACI|nr:DNA primase [Tenuibacillus multivorans]GEL78306.1 DNA primase [Tenuibacillus multivorans]SDN19014.1 DNA primase [Tenuibacillus multivorans]
MVNKISQETIDQITDNNNIVDVISEYIKLTKRGRNYFGLCPFHGEDTPSFSVSPEKQIFHCFGCGKGGNVASFMMEIEQISFTEALKKLADKSGDQLPQEWLSQNQDRQYSSDQHDVLQAYEWSTKLFHHVLKHTKDGKDALNYLKNRGFSEEAIEHFQLGFSPRKDQFLAKFLQGKGFKPEKLQEYGLINSRDGNTFFDRFQGRVIFPIHNHQGKVVGYGGRSMVDDEQPKYLNSPESTLFQKGKILYNFHQARKHFQKSNTVVLFEGYADVIKAHQAGVYHAVATMGTSLSDTHVKILKQYVDEVIICFDGDKAGKNASYRTANMLKKAGLNARIANVPNEMDPDEYIEKFGSEPFRKQVIESAESYVAFALQYIKKDYNLNVDHDRVQYVEKSLDIIATVNQAVERDFHLKELEETFNLDRNTLNQEIEIRRRIMRRTKDNDIHVRKSNVHQPNWNQNQKIYSAYENAERHLIAHMLQDAYISNRVQQRLGSVFNIEEHQVLVTYLYAYYEEGNEPNVSRLIERLPEDSIKQLATELAVLPINESLNDQELEDYFIAIQKEHEWSKEIRKLKQMLKQAEKENDPQSAARIGMKIIELKKNSIN